MSIQRDQVQLSELVFAHNWEDPESDHAALKIRSNDRLLAITSGGCNVLGFLLFDPSIVYSIDINPAQSFLLELKIAAIKNLSFTEFISFLGVLKSENRIVLYHKIKKDLSKKSSEFWDRQSNLISQGIFMNGKYERFIKIAGKIINILQGKRRVSGLFENKTKSEQELYFDKIWNTKRFHFLFKIIFNKYVLAKKGLVADYFLFDDGSKSFAECFYKRAKRAFRGIPIKSNYFLALYLLNKYINDDERPAYLKKENFEIIKSRVQRIKIITGDVQHWLESVSPDSIDCFALSNICELMSEGDKDLLFTNVFRAASPNARIIFRNLMIPREVPVSLQDQIVLDKILSMEIYKNDRSFVYGKVNAYYIKK